MVTALHSRGARLPVAAELEPSKWKALKGDALTAQLEASVKGVKLDADTLRTTVMTLTMLGVKPKEPGLINWLNDRAPGVLAESSKDDREGLLRQLGASGVPKEILETWNPRGWGQRVGPSNEKLMASSDSRRAMMARVGRQFPGTTISSHPPMASVFARDPAGKKAPIKLTVEGSTLRLEQGPKSVKQRVPAGASAAQLDAAVEALARALTRNSP